MKMQTAHAHGIVVCEWLILMLKHLSSADLEVRVMAAATQPSYHGNHGSRLVKMVSSGLQLDLAVACFGAAAARKTRRLLRCDLLSTEDGKRDQQAP